MYNTLRAGFSEQIENSAAEMSERLEPLRAAARSEAENLGHAVTQLVPAPTYTIHYFGVADGLDVTTSYKSMESAARNEKYGNLV